MSCGIGWFHLWFVVDVAPLPRRLWVVCIGWSFDLSLKLWMCRFNSCFVYVLESDTSSPGRSRGVSESIRQRRSAQEIAGVCLNQANGSFKDPPPCLEQERYRHLPATWSACGKLIGSSMEGVGWRTGCTGVRCCAFVRPSSVRHAGLGPAF